MVKLIEAGMPHTIARKVRSESEGTAKVRGVERYGEPVRGIFSMRDGGA